MAEIFIENQINYEKNEKLHANFEKQSSVFIIFQVGQMCALSKNFR